jgi:prepilin-type processing-associated H-X9-DG protein
MGMCTINRKNTAFTLGELLVVIAVIALMISILLPALNKARQSARATLCRGLIRNYTFAQLAYLQEFNLLMPVSINDPVMRPWLTYDYFRSFLNLKPLSQHYKQRRTEIIQEYKASYPRDLICPSATYALSHAEDGLYPLDRSYGLNCHLYSDKGPQLIYKKASEIACYSDCLDWWYNSWFCDSYARTGERWLGYETYGVAAFRHSKFANISFWDGRVEKLTPTALKRNLAYWFYVEGTTPPQ